MPFVIKMDRKAAAVAETSDNGLSRQKRQQQEKQGSESRSQPANHATINSVSKPGKQATVLPAKQAAGQPGSS